MIVDNSTLSGFSKCHIYGALAYWLHRAPTTSSLPATLGQCAHKVMRAHFNGELTINVINECVNTLRKIATDQPEVSKYLNETVAKFHSLVTSIVGAYPIMRMAQGQVILDTKSKQPKYYVRHTEIPFKLPLGDGHHTIIGSIDAVVEDDYGHWRIWELKTSRYASSATWQRQWRLSTQPLTYEFAAQAHTRANVRGTLIVPFSTSTLDCTPQRIIEIEHTPQALAQWESDVITYLDWLTAIAEEVGITFNTEGRAIVPEYYLTHEEEYAKHCSSVLSKLIPTGRFCGNCSSNAFGQCSYYGICTSNYLPGYIASQTTLRIWNPLEEYKE